MQNALESANRSEAEYTYLVLGHSASDIVGIIRPGRAQILLNNEYRKGLSTSLKASISNLPQDCAGAIFMVGDQPFVNTKNLDMMIRIFKMNPERIIALGSRKEPRNPALIPRQLFQEIAALKGDVGAREIVRRHLDKTRLIEVSGNRAFLDIDTRSDLEKVAKERG